MKKMRKVAEFLRKAVVALRGKASVLRARLLFLASLRRRTAVVGAISHHLRALMPGNAPPPAAAAPDGGRLPAAEDDDEQMTLDDVAGLSELATLFQEVDDDDGARYPDWTHSMFDDDDDGEGGGEEAVSVMEVIRRRREGDGEEFDMEEEIDHAADMFIRRVRHRMAANRRSF
ncbi:uncharacterized protein LOC127781521 [Oryza glaberrima]|uniref:Uncharacterized protein n=1 Tax=Oryza glaberrima TaxID=4538 RepID=I1QLE7_ORYGL|nr:uncharacterized protein LOC127781521 [Oryza glaberrima]